MKNYIYALLFPFLIVGCNNRSSDAEKEYIKNLEEKNRQLEIELENKESELESNSGDNAKKSATQSESSKNYFTIGSTENEVLNVMGDPTSLRNIGPYKTYYYELSSVTFENGKVRDYDNDGNLKVRVRN
ncbi:MAG: hypothetical protein ACN6OI_00400 [Flavobacterium sp.]|jgi:uncharacterized lipoprotein NlpE involved in copper resistance|uniref:hypothetical protein n=1 Tax=Flavobacterium sp. TaxID=239 RepID=UPI003D097B52